MAPYTYPSIRMEDGTSIQESWAIARALEPLYPTPSAHLDDPVAKRVEQEWRNAIGPLRPVLVPRMPNTCLCGTTIEFHRNARKKTFGMPLEEFESKHGGEEAWEKGMPGLRNLAAILKEDPKGPFCLGDTPSYADFWIVGFLEWARCVSIDNDIFNRIMGVDKAFGDVYEACSPWLKRNDY